MTIKIGTKVIAGSPGMATLESVGTVRPDGSTITVEDGVISVVSGSIAGGVLVVDTYVNGASWYRIWSDGWIEQGGYATTTTVTYLKAFKNTNYSLAIGDIRSGNSGTYFHVRSRSATGFTAAYDGGHAKSWYACGF